MIHAIKSKFLTFYKRLGSNSLERKQIFAGYLFILPNFIGFLCFVFLPVFASLFLSFFKWDMIQTPTFIGIKNYIMMVNKPIFWKTLVNTLYYTVTTVPLTIIFGLLLAVLVNKTKGGVVYKTGYFLPYLISTVAAALIWQTIYMPNFGIMTYILQSLHLPAPPWLSDARWAMPAIIIMSVWKNIGFAFIVFLAGLQGISSKYYEAAEIDGANGIQQFFKITLPLMTPTIFFISVISIINSFKVFDQAFVLTQGGPADSTKTLVYHIYEEGFEFFRMGYASAVGWFLLIIIFAITLLQFNYQKRWVTYE